MRRVDARVLSFAASQIRPRTGCSIVALVPAEGEMDIVPPPERVLQKGMDLILIGSPEQEERFSRVFAKKK